MKNFDFMPFVSIGLIFVIMYFLVIRPQSKKAKEHQNMLNALKKGDRIVTSGGLIGVITQIHENELEIQVAPSVHVLVARPMVSTLLSADTKVKTSTAKTLTKTKQVKKK